MPNRVLRDWTDSEPVDALSVHAERFFTRLIMKVDDHGRYLANHKILKSTLFPLKTDVRETDIVRWLAECKQSDLIVLYSVASKEYLQIINFKQVLRQKLEKYPGPEKANLTCYADAAQTTSGCGTEKKRNESEKKGKEDVASATAHTKDFIEKFSAFEQWLSKHASNVARMKEPFTIDQYYKLTQKFDKDQIKELLLKMHNWRDLNKKNVSAYLTISNWSKKDFNNTSNESTKQQGTSVNDQLKLAGQKAQG